MLRSSLRALHALWYLPPGTMAREVPLFVQIAGPSVVIQIAQFLVWIANTAWLGRGCGEEAMGGIALGNLSGNLSGMSIIYGFFSALDTLAPQEMGAGRHREVGILAQRGFAICLLAVLPAAVLWWFMEDALVWAGQPAVASAHACRFLRVFSAALPPIIAFESARRFLSAQGIVKPIAWVVLAGSAAHPLLLWLWAGTDCAGGDEARALQSVAAATVCTNLVWCGGTLLYIRLARPHHPATWPGWCWREAICGTRRGGGGSSGGGKSALAAADSVKEARSGGGGSSSGGGGGGGGGGANPVCTFLRLGVPGILSMSEWWFWEGVCFMAGALGTTTLAAHTVAYNMIPLCFMASFGLSIGIATRVGTLLGEGGSSVRTARALTFRFFVLGVLVASAIGAAVYGCRDSITDVFLGSAAKMEVRAGVVLIWPAVCVFIALDGVFALCMGVIRSLGLQARQSAAVLLSLWAVGLPCMHHAAFGAVSAADAGATDYSPERLVRLRALWSWMPTTYVVANAFLVLAFSTVDWAKVSEAVRARDGSGGGGGGDGEDGRGAGSEDGDMALSLRPQAAAAGSGII